jgi:hypothetical protein
VFLLLTPLLPLAARSPLLATTQSTHSPQAARLKFSVAAAWWNTLLLLAAVAAVGQAAVVAAQAAIVLLSWVKALEVVRPLSPR